MGSLTELSIAGAAILAAALLSLAGSQPRHGTRAPDAPAPRSRRRGRRRARRGRGARLAAAPPPAPVQPVPAPDPTQLPAAAIGSMAAPAPASAQILPAPIAVPGGPPVLQPDPARLIQHEVTEPTGVVARLAALLRLLLWLGLAGLGFALAALGGVRGIAWILERLTGP